MAALGAFVAHRGNATMAILVFGFFMAALSLGHRADSAARNQPLRLLFDRHLGRGEHQIFVTAHGRLRDDATNGPSGVTLNVSIDRIELDGATYETAGGALIGVGGDVAADQILQWRAGRRVAFPATLRRPTRYLNPGVPDGERQMAWRGTALVGSVKSGRLIEVVARGGAIDETLGRARAAVRRAVASSVGPYSERSAAIVLAILIGDRAGLSDEVERRLQEAGTYHVIAISGGNIAIVSGLFVVLFRAARVGPRVSATLVVAILSVYALGVGGGASVGRATLMAAIYFAARVWDQRTAPLNVAALTAVALFSHTPLQAVDAGFALTFGATLGILVGMARFADVLMLSGRARAPAALLAASACAEAALLPVNAFVFSRITFAGLIVNFAAIPLMTIAQIAGMAAVAASNCLPDLVPWIGWVAHLAVEGLIGSAVIVEWMPWLTRRLAPPSLAVVALYYAALTIAVAPPSRRMALQHRLPGSSAARQPLPLSRAVCGLSSHL